MQVVYYKLFDKLKSEGIVQKEFIQDLSIGGSIMHKLRHNENVTTETIGKICEYLNCQPNDIMEVIPDENISKKYEEKRKAKANVEAQIAELQAKLKNM